MVKKIRVIEEKPAEEETPENSMMEMAQQMPSMFLACHPQITGRML